MPSRDDDIRESILFQLKVLRIATVATMLVILLVAAFVVVRTSQINDALCTFRTDLQARAAGAQDYLDHPNRYPGIRVPRDVVRQQLDGQLKTIQSLEALSC